MREALALLRAQAPWLEVDGEMHGDVALDGALPRTTLMPDSTLTGEANLLVLPNIDAANISYNLLKTAAGGGIAIGPVLLGAAKPVHILTPSATVRRIVNMTALDRRRRQRRTLTSCSAVRRDELSPCCTRQSLRYSRDVMRSLKALASLPKFEAEA